MKISIFFYLAELKLEKERESMLLDNSHVEFQLLICTNISHKFHETLVEHESRWFHCKKLKENFHDRSTIENFNTNMFDFLQRVISNHRKVRMALTCKPFVQFHLWLRSMLLNLTEDSLDWTR